MATKYIVNNISGQTINGDAILRPYTVYSALVTQAGVSNPLLISDVELTIGVTYAIKTGVGGDFTNVGAPNNNIGTYFVATGTTPTTWGEMSLEYDSGAPVVTVLENTIGNIVWAYDSTGEYLGTLTETFISGKTYFTALPSQVTQLKFVRVNDNIVNLGTASGGIKTNGLLNNTPIEIRIYN